MSTEKSYETFPYSNAFQACGEDEATYMCERATARVKAAVQGAQTLTALMVQRETDAGTDLAPGCWFNPTVAHGILSALACCLEVIEIAADGRLTPLSLGVDAGSAAGQHLAQAARAADRIQRGAP